MEKYFIYIAASSRVHHRCLTAVVLLCVLAVLWPNLAQAATDGKETGARLLRAELPKGASIQQTDCELLSRAVSRATLAHRADAPAILNAALTNGNTEDVPRKEDKRPCECVAHIVRACVKVAPEQASAVLDVALALYPDCSDALATILDEAKKNLQAYDYNNNGAEEPVAGINNVGNVNPTGSGFNNGFGAGFPGSPGFSGSTPTGGTALPSSGITALPPSGVTAVTSAVNQ